MKLDSVIRRALIFLIYGTPPPPVRVNFWSSQATARHMGMPPNLTDTLYHPNKQ